MQREGGLNDAQASHKFSAHLRQRAEQMLDAGARRGDASVAPLLRGGNTFSGMAPALDVDLPAGFFRALSRSALG